MSYATKSARDSKIMSLVLPLFTARASLTLVASTLGKKMVFGAFCRVLELRLQVAGRHVDCGDVT